MSKNSYLTVSGLIFLVVALGHGFRAAQGLSMNIGSFAVPLWASWVAAVGGLLLCIWAFRSRKA
jgi:hypothetical protein